MTFEKYLKKYLKNFGLITEISHMRFAEDAGVYICYDDNNDSIFCLTNPKFIEIFEEYEEYQESRSKDDYKRGLQRALEIVEQSYSKFCEDVDYSVHHNYYEIIHELKKGLKK